MTGMTANSVWHVVIKGEEERLESNDGGGLKTTDCAALHCLKYFGHSAPPSWLPMTQKKIKWQVTKEGGCPGQDS